ncbi:MAG: fasciclin domain-containing protein [Thermoleophilia bacterium]
MATEETTQPDRPRRTRPGAILLALVAALVGVIVAAVLTSCTGPSDGEIAAKVRSALAVWGVTGVDVSVDGGTVRLSGTVPTDAAQATAGSVAADVAGVEGVQNAIEVAVPAPVEPAPTPPAPEPTPAPEPPPPAPTPAEPAEPGTIVEVAQAAGTFQVLLDAATTAGIVDELGQPGPYTVFAPTDAAFAAWTTDAAQATPEAILQLLLGHVVPGAVTPDQLVDGAELQTAAGTTLAVAVDGDAIAVGGAPLAGDPVEASNGLVYPLGGVIPQPATVVDIARAGGYGALVSGIEDAGLAEQLRGQGPFTLLAPSDAALSALSDEQLQALQDEPGALERFLLGHVIGGKLTAADLAGLDTVETLAGTTLRIEDVGGTLRIGGATVTQADVEADNGIVHGLAGVAEPTPARGTIVDVATDAGSFSTLLAALDAAGLTETLGGEGPYTVFAPTDEAFAALPAGTVDGLLADPEALTALLLNHVVEGAIGPAELADLTDVQTVGGATLQVAVEPPETILVGGAPVAGAPAEASNGLVYALGGVIADEAPAAAPAPTVVDALAAQPGYQALLAALEQTGLLEGLQGPGPFTLFAPSDEALAALPPEIANDPERLKAALLWHVSDGRVTPQRLARLKQLTTFAGAIVPVGRDGDAVTVAGAAVAGDPIDTGNGLVYPLAAAIVPTAGGKRSDTVNEILGLQPVRFESGSAEIAPAGRRVLDKAARYLELNPLELRIEGHTDSDGDDASNLTLSQRRAEAVKAYLVSKGIPARLMTTRGFGEARPVATNDTAAGKARNRRIEFVIL